MDMVWMDRLGGVASATCAVHCLVLSFAPALVALLGLELFADELFEWAFFGTALVFALLAAVVGYSGHRTWWVAAGFGVGMGTLIAGRLGEALELFEGGGVVSIVGGALLLASHLASLRCTAACRAAQCA